ncbi:hypothetical protein BT96DRAFT_757565, partial [Gymnopus androsaceus JB14]
KVVVKFCHTYGADGHQLLASALLAPQLRFCERVDHIGLFVVVMDYIETDDEEETETETWKEGVRRGVELLHKNNLVFGDLRLPNLLRSKGQVYFIDFDWCGRENEVRYPSDIILGIHWHPDVQPMRLITKAHD